MKIKVMIYISDEAEKFGGIQNFCPKEKNWLFYILLWPIIKSSEKLMLG